MTQRDYTKFIRESETGPRLHVKMLPRPVYVKMVNQWRSRPDVIETVAEQAYWLWDLKELERRALAEGRAVTHAELAEEIMGEMDDRDWWKTTEAFEEHLITSFPTDPGAWAELLDPIFDLQEQEGWKPRQ
ncbi:MAG: hypothetical protein WEC79_09225 [Thermomicrobiales bacterium]